LTTDLATNRETVSSAARDRRNFGAFLADYVFFGLALAFIGQNTVLPAFVRQLTASPLLIGLNGTINTVGWLLPQLVAARYLRHKARKKRYLLIPGLVGRPAFFLLALALLLGGAQWPGFMLALAFALMALFRITDALGAVAWFDILGKALPSNRRSHLFGWGQILSGLLSIGAGLLINFILGHAGPVFPQNYAIIFLIAGVIMVFSWVAEVFIYEPKSESEVEPTSSLPFRQQLIHIWRRDRNFRLFIAVRLLVGLSDLSIPFYVVFARDVLAVDEAAVGSFTSAQIVGGMVGAVILGALYDRWGGKRAVQFGVGAAAFAPIWALALPWLFPGYQSGLVYAFGLVFVALGLLQSAYMQGFYNYLLDLSPAGERSTYVALANAINGVALAPVALTGGAILKITNNSFVTLFAVTALAMGLGLLFTTQLHDLRHEQWAGADTFG